MCSLEPTDCSCACAAGRRRRRRGRLEPPVGRTGRQLVALPVAPLAGRAGSYQIDLPLSSVAPGDYVIAVEAVRGQEKAETHVAVRVR